jgi:protein-S-isoprenylcysteine O-methyltransferase Ste14
VGLTALFFLDAPFRTLGQRYVRKRHRERLIRLSLELDLLALWAVAWLVLHWRWPLVPAVAAPGVAVAGLALASAGAALAVAARLRLGRGFSATFAVKEGHVLVTDGPYAVTRHPIYTGLLALLAGGALATNTALTLLLGVLMGVPFFFHTVYEESLFEQHFGAPYFEYQRRVPRLLPWPRPRPAAATSETSPS